MKVIDVQQMMHELYYSDDAVNMAGEYKGLWIRWKAIDEYIEKHCFDADDRAFEKCETKAIEQAIKEKPPLGLMPEKIWNTKRRIDIIEAMNRYAEAEKKIPDEWIAELLFLNYKIAREEESEAMRL